MFEHECDHVFHQAFLIESDSCLNIHSQQLGLALSAHSSTQEIDQLFNDTISKELRIVHHLPPKAKHDV